MGRGFSDGKGNLGAQGKMKKKAKNFPSHMPSTRGGLIYHKGNLPYPMKFHHENPAYLVKYHRGISTCGQKGGDEKCNPRKSDKVEKEDNFDFFERKRLHLQVVFSQKQLVWVIFNRFGHLRCPKTSFRVLETSIASEKREKYQRKAILE